jgi:hypothetical protein
MACDLGRGATSMRFMAQDDALDSKVVPLFAIAEFGRFRIVIPANPDPFFGKITKRCERLPVGLYHAFARASVMKAVTKANNPSRLIGLHNESEADQRVVAVERRNKPASCRCAGAFLQMQVGDNQGGVARKVGRPAVIQRHRKTRELDRNGRNPIPETILGLCDHAILFCHRGIVAQQLGRISNADEAAPQARRAGKAALGHVADPQRAETVAVAPTSPHTARELPRADPFNYGFHGAVWSFPGDLNETGGPLKVLRLWERLYRS